MKTDQLKKCKCIKSDDSYIFEENNLIKGDIYLYRKIKNYSIFTLNESLIDIINETEFNETFIDIQTERKLKLLKLKL